jgi:DNA-binding response OmpR family regulator
MRIYLVEDDGDLRNFLVLALQDEFDIRGFERGDEALAALRREPPDVLLTDLSLPGLNGEALAREAGRLERAPGIIVMSADGGRLRRARPLAQAALSKPFLLAELRRVLRRVAESAPEEIE